MLKGLYAAVSAMVASINKQALKAHNIANLTTPGFKQLYTTLQEAQKTEVFPSGQNSQNKTSQSIGYLGLGVMTTETRSKFSNGALQETRQSFDFAIQGDGFFRILTPDGERYTRDGRFIRDANNNLVTIDGNRVLNSSGVSILIPNGESFVDTSGGILMNGTKITQLGIAEFNQPETQLQKDGGNLFVALADPSLTTFNTTIHQGYLEMSNVNVVDLMISAKTYEAAQKMVQTQDELLGKSISTLGKLA
jgi:flagellar basal-body rod protein FlgF